MESIRLLEDRIIETVKKSPELIEIGNIFLEVPPSSVLYGRQTSDRREKWQEDRFFYKLVGAEFITLRLGEPSPLENIPESCPSLSENYKETVRLIARIYGHLLDAIRDCWRMVLEEIKLEVEKGGMQALGLEAIPQSPRELVGRVIYWDSLTKFQPCLQWSKCHPRTAARRYQDAKTVKLLSNREVLTKGDEKKLNNARSRLRKFKTDAGLRTDNPLGIFLEKTLGKLYSKNQSSYNHFELLQITSEELEDLSGQSAGGRLAEGYQWEMGRRSNL